MHKHLVCGIAIGLVVGLSTGAVQADQFSGMVVDEKGQPLAGAKVSAFETRSNAGVEREDRELGAVVTGADGLFKFVQRPEAPLVIIVATKDGRGLDWAYGAEGVTGGLVLQLGPAGAIEGEIVDENGKPVGGASVHALLLMEAPGPRQMYAPLPGNALTVKTDPLGRFRFANVPEAAIVGFDVSAPGRARALAEPHFAPGQKGLRFVLPPEGRLEGIVVDKGTGQPLADVCLLAVGSLSGGVQQAWAKTDRQGRFSMAGLSGGKYDIEIVGSGQALPEWLGSPAKVQVETGRVSPAVRVEASRGGILELALTDARTGKPLAAAASVQISPAEDLRIRRTGFASKEGVARLCLAPGNYVVAELWATGYAYKPEEGKSIRVETGKTVRAALAVIAVPQVAGLVRDLAGKSVPGAKVQVLPLRGPPKNLIAGEDGRFAVDSADIGPLFCFISVRHPQQNLAATQVVGKEAKLLAITLQPLANVSGTVLDSRGRPAAGAIVQAQIDGSHFGRFAVMATAQTDKDGHYQMELAGTSLDYAITAKAPGFGPAETVVPQRNLVSGPAKVKDLVLEAADRGIRGVVQDPQGRPLPGVIVLAKPMGGPPFRPSVVTDDKGQFALEHLTLAPVIYLFAKAPGRGWIGDCTIHPGDTEAVIGVGPSHYD